MAADAHVALLMQGVENWNAWRRKNVVGIRPDFRDSDFTGMNLDGALLFGSDFNRARLIGASFDHANMAACDFTGADLTDANLFRAHLQHANLAHANLSKANLFEANLIEANLQRAILREATLGGANCSLANLSEADLRGAILEGMNLHQTVLAGANLSGVNLQGAVLFKTDFSNANLSGVNLRFATVVEANLTRADLTNCAIYGISAWRLMLDGATQHSLLITADDEPAITVDNVEVAQFVHLMLNNEKLRNVIDTITTKVVLILGRFAGKRKAVLNALREELRKRNYLPIVFDFDVPTTRDITETVSLLAHMSRFIIADLTDPSSIPKELEAIVPTLAVPVQPLLEGPARPYAMFKDYWKYQWVLPIYWYEGLEPLLAALAEKVIAPAELKSSALAEQRRRFEAEQIKPS